MDRKQFKIDIVFIVIAVFLSVARIKVNYNTPIPLIFSVISFVVIFYRMIKVWATIRLMMLFILCLCLVSNLILF